MAQKYFDASNVVGKLLLFGNSKAPYKITAVLKNIPTQSTNNSSANIHSSHGAQHMMTHDTERINMTEQLRKQTQKGRCAGLN